MYIITAVRYSRYGGVNRHHKGAFKMQFETLDKFVAFINNCGMKSVYFPYLKDELTKKEYTILMNKYASVVQW